MAKSIIPCQAAATLTPDLSNTCSVVDNSSSPINVNKQHDT